MKFILHEDNVCLFAWGIRKKVIKGTGETVASFPDCARKRSAIDMYNCYKSLTLPDDNKLLCKSTFLDLVHILTVDNNQVVKAVDYVQGMLLNKPCGTLQRIIDDLISDLSMRKDFTRKPLKGRWLTLTFCHLATHCLNLKMIMHGQIYKKVLARLSMIQLFCWTHTFSLKINVKH